MGMVKILLPELVVANGLQLCGSAEAESRKYHLVYDKDGTAWLYANQPNAADNIYVAGGSDSKGFGGRTISFPLVQGGTMDLVGPWHTSADSLFKHTGVDIRDKHLTQAAIGLRRKMTGDRTTLLDVIYYEDRPVLGLSDRPDIYKMAAEFTERLNYSVQVSVQGYGGGMTGPVNPGATPENKWGGAYVAPPLKEE